MFIARPDRNVRMFFRICDVCGLGSGTDNNMKKTMVQLIGVNRTRNTWPLIKELDLLWIKEGQQMEIEYGCTAVDPLASDACTR
eukprot:SAG31_NODE_706_length_12688_cov_41.991342_10_plen_84_part_00